MPSDTGRSGQCRGGCPDYPGTTDAYPFPVVRYPSFDTTKIVGYRAGYPFSPRAMEALADFSPDIIHTHCPVMSTVMAVLSGNAWDVPVVFTYHTKFDIDIRRALSGHLLQQTAIRLLVDNISACDEVWVVSQGAGENLRSLGYVGDYTVMENGVDFPEARYLRRSRSPASGVRIAQRCSGVPFCRPYDVV